MSDATDRDLLAAEYVLGCLEGDEAQEAARLLASDAAFAQAVRAWEARLTPLASLAAPVGPPADLWTRIAAATAQDGATVVPLKPQGVLRRPGFWQATTAASLALAASLAGFIVLRPPAPARIAVLAPAAGGAPVVVAVADPDGALRLRPTGTIAVPSDRDLELWALAEGETRPRSLGVLPAAGRQLVATLAPETQLLVSLEPKGGSPTGQPTGPVLYGGRLVAMN
jgi:anti-sigma-K factor RskA